MSEKGLLTTAEAAERLKIAKRTLLRWARERRIESVRISNKKILFTDQAIERFLQARTHGIESGSVTKDRTDRRPTRPNSKEGGGKRSSGELWKDLRKEVKQWQ
jgi:excisionase family DNA binding protein